MDSAYLGRTQGEYMGMASAPSTLTAGPSLSASGRERPVFLDESGRRARVVRFAGRLMGGATVAWLGALVVGASAAPTLPSLARQLASIRGASATRVAGGHGLGRHTPASHLTFARLTARPDVSTATIADARADVPSNPA
jgi:hypothetical protein